MKKKLVLLSTSVPIVPVFTELVKRMAPELSVSNIVDDTIVSSIAKNGNVVPPNIFARMCDYCRIAEDMGADALLLTCSSISEAIDIAQPQVSIPLFKIDEPMAEEAVRRADTSIGVVATVMTTLAPTTRLVQRKIAESGKQLSIKSHLCEGALELYIAGEHEKHDRMVCEGIEMLLDSCDCVVLAQASMARATALLSDAQRAKILTSPELGVKRVVDYLRNSADA